MDGQCDIVTTEKGIVVWMGKEILPYLDLSKAEPTGYPGGTARKEDLVILLAGEKAFSPAQKEELLSSIGASELASGYVSDLAAGQPAGAQETAFLAAGLFHCPEVSPILKWGIPLNVNTILNGVELEIDWKEGPSGAAAKAVVRVGGQSLSREIPADGCLLVLCGEEGIRCFTPADGRGEAASASGRFALSVLPGERYEGWLESWKTGPDAAGTILESEGMELDHFFSAELVERLRQAQEEAELIFPFRGRAVSVRRTILSLPGRRLIRYTLRDSDRVFAELRHRADLYGRLVGRQSEGEGGGPFTSNFRLWGQDRGTTHVKVLLQKASATGITILLTGESGTGKTYLAREIHNNSKRRERSFIHVNCASIPAGLIESELFGYAPGAFTGAKREGKKGYFELADQGTLFLDEVTELPLALQGRLLEVLQDRTFYRVGGTEKITVNVRLIAATNRNLKELVSAGEFREDLYYRINAFPIELLPLRERISGLYGIVAALLPDICEKIEVEPLVLSPEALEKMKEYSWPGNIRELENTLEKAAILCGGRVILPEDILLPDSERPVSQKLKERVEAFEKETIVRALERFHGEKQKTADYLGIGRTSLFEKIRKYEIEQQRSME